MLSGTDSADGFLSQKEYLCEWGKRILIGSGLLGRTPMDVVAVETCLVEKIVPADPVDVNSRKEVSPQAGP